MYIYFKKITYTNIMCWVSHIHTQSYEIFSLHLLFDQGPGLSPLAYFSKLVYHLVTIQLLSLKYKICTYLNLRLDPYFLSVYVLNPKFTSSPKIVLFAFWFKMANKRGDMDNFSFVHSCFIIVVVSTFCLTSFCVNTVIGKLINYIKMTFINFSFQSQKSCIQCQA